jgi:hypothetical protein
VALGVAAVAYGSASARRFDGADDARAAGHVAYGDELRRQGGLVRGYAMAAAIGGGLALASGIFLVVLSTKAVGAPATKSPPSLAPTTFSGQLAPLSGGALLTMRATF